MNWLEGGVDVTSHDVHKNTVPSDLYQEWIRILGLSQTLQLEIEKWRRVYNNINRALTFPLEGLWDFLDSIESFFEQNSAPNKNLGNFPEASEDVRWKLKYLVNSIVTTDPNADFTITLWMANRQELERFRYLLFLVHFWKMAPSHIWTIPSIDEYRIESNKQWWLSITSLTDAASHYLQLANQYFHSLKWDHNKVYPLMLLEKWSYKVVRHIMHGKTDTADKPLVPQNLDNDPSLAVVEIYIVTWGEVLTQWSFDIKTVKLFIDKHWENIDEVLQYLWIKWCRSFFTAAARNYIDDKKNSETSESKKARPRKGRIENGIPRPVSRWATSVLEPTDTKKNLENYHYPVPKITPSFVSELSRGKHWVGKRTKLVSNMPYSDQTVLWIFEPIQNWETWRAHRWEEEINLKYIRDFTYRFFFSAESLEDPNQIDTEKNPIKEMSVLLKQKKPEPISDTVQWDVTHAVEVSLTRANNDIFEACLRIIEAIENKKYTLDANTLSIQDISYGGLDFTYRESSLSLSASPDLPADTTNEILSLVSDVLVPVFLDSTKKLQEWEVQRLLKALRPITKEVRKWRNRFLYRDDQTVGSDIWQIIQDNRNRNWYFWAAIFQPRYKEIKARIEALQWDFQMRLERIDSELQVSLLGGDNRVLGTVISMEWNKEPYKVTILEGLDSKIHDRVFDILVTTLAFCGQIWAEKIFDESWKRILSPSEILAILDPRPSGETLRRNSTETNIPEWSMKQSRDLIREAYTRFQEWRWKIALFDGYKPDGLYWADIHGKQHTSVLSDTDTDYLVVLVDEKTSSVQDGKKWDPRIYERIERVPRLQKYLLRRAAITAGQVEKVKVDSKWKEPFTNSMKTVFLKFWWTLSREQRQEFLSFFQEGWAGSEWAIKMQIEWDLFIKKILHAWEQASVQIVYLRPKIIPLDLMQVRLELVDMGNNLLEYT